MKKLLIISILLLVFLALGSVDSISASNVKYTNSVGVEFKNSEIVHLKKLGLIDREIEVLTSKEKEKYLAIKTDYVHQSVVYEKIEKVKKAKDGKIVEKTIVTLIDEEETLLFKESTDGNFPDETLSTTFMTESCISPEYCFEDGGGDGTVDYYYAYDESDIAVRKLTLTGAYNYTTDHMFVKVTVEWYNMPALPRGWEIINIRHTENAWYIKTNNLYNPDIGGYEQTIEFTGKQMYDWTYWERETTYGPLTYGPTVPKTIYYDEDIDNGYFHSDVTKGIALKMNLKNNEQGETMQYDYGYNATNFVLSLEADFENTGNNTNGIFYGGYVHQEGYISIDISEVTFTLTPPFVNLPTAGISWGDLYEDEGLGTSINIPIS
ncbi:MAG: hypothetical protein K9L74_02440 [Candidatus Izimaplasma sp.]|nr:hypothetical protein [Candidatus Izimaplasma bacterium]